MSQKTSVGHSAAALACCASLQHIGCGNDGGLIDDSCWISSLEIPSLRPEHGIQHARQHHQRSPVASPGSAALPMAPNVDFISPSFDSDAASSMAAAPFNAVTAHAATDPMPSLPTHTFDAQHGFDDACESQTQHVNDDKSTAPPSEATTEGATVRKIKSATRQKTRRAGKSRRTKPLSDLEKSVMSLKEIMQHYFTAVLATVDRTATKGTKALAKADSDSLEAGLAGDDVQARLKSAFIMQKAISEIRSRFPSDSDDITSQIFDLDTVPFPTTWLPCPRCADPDSKHEHVGRALSDANGVVRCHVIPVREGSDEYKRVTGPMKMRGMDIIAIGRVQNRDLHDRYMRKSQEDALRPGENSMTMMELYHGTRCNNMFRMLVEGLDQRLAGQGRFGRGIYFSDDPIKSHEYTPNSSQIKCLLHCSVLLGRVKEYAPLETNTRLLREPTGFDSVKGNVTGHNEYVVYDSQRVVINHIIYYQQMGAGMCSAQG